MHMGLIEIIGTFGAEYHHLNGHTNNFFNFKSSCINKYKVKVQDETNSIYGEEKNSTCEMSFVSYHLNHNHETVSKQIFDF